VSYEWIVCNSASLLQTIVIGVVGLFAHKAYTKQNNYTKEQNNYIKKQNEYEKDKRIFDAVFSMLERAIEILNVKMREGIPADKERYKSVNIQCKTILDQKGKLKDKTLANIFQAYLEDRKVQFAELELTKKCIQYWKSVNVDEKDICYIFRLFLLDGISSNESFTPEELERLRDMAHGLWEYIIERKNPTCSRPFS